MPQSVALKVSFLTRNKVTYKYLNKSYYIYESICKYLPSVHTMSLERCGLMACPKYPGVKKHQVIFWCVRLKINDIWMSYKWQYIHVWGNFFFKFVSLPRVLFYFIVKSAKNYISLFSCDILLQMFMRVMTLPHVRPTCYAGTPKLVALPPSMVYPSIPTT